MIRVRSTDVWFNAPGIQAAYQPVAAPDSLAARQNVGNDLRMAGRHTAIVNGAGLLWNANGWVVASAGPYLSTGVTPSGGYSMSIQFAGVTATGYICGQYSVSFRFDTHPNLSGTMTFWGYGSDQITTTPSTLSGNLTTAGPYAYRNGVRVGGKMTDTTGTAVNPISIFERLGATNPCNGSVQAFFVSAITLTPAHVAQYSQQMAYCHVNPDWSAWGRRRRYYYAPSAAAGVIWRGVGRNSSPVGGSPGIGRTP